MKKEQFNIPSTTIDLVKGIFDTSFEVSDTPLSKIYDKEEVLNAFVSITVVIQNTLHRDYNSILCYN